MKIDKAEYTHSGSREENEDSLCCEIKENVGVYAIVADGLGGHENGKLASEIAVQKLSRCGQCNALPTKTQILQWFEEANQEILSR